MIGEPTISASGEHNGCEGWQKWTAANNFVRGGPNDAFVLVVFTGNNTLRHMANRHLQLVSSTPQPSIGDMDLVLCGAGGEPDLYVKAGQRRSLLAALNKLAFAHAGSRIDAATAVMPCEAGVRLIWWINGTVFSRTFPMECLERWRRQLDPAYTSARAPIRHLAAVG